nr:PilZ domain-containing protein [Tsuneonella dongtanensis]
MLRRVLPAQRSGQRCANRLRLGVPAGLLLTHRTHRCLIDDISSTGARIRVEQEIAVGRTAMLQFHRLRLYGSVIWYGDGECGIRFDRKMEAEDIEGFLWIVQNPEAYERLCRESGGHDWAMGLGG